MSIKEKVEIFHKSRLKSRVPHSELAEVAQQSDVIHVSSAHGSASSDPSKKQTHAQG